MRCVRGTFDESSGSLGSVLDDDDDEFELDCECWCWCEDGDGAVPSGADADEAGWVANARVTSRQSSGASCRAAAVAAAGLGEVRAMTSECEATRRAGEDDEGEARERLRAVRSAGVRCMVCRMAVVL